MKKSLFAFVSLLITLSLTLTACGGPGASAATEKAPDFSLPATSGKMVSLAELKGKPVFINFWEAT